MLTANSGLRVLCSALHPLCTSVLVCWYNFWRQHAVYVQEVSQGLATTRFGQTSAKGTVRESVLSRRTSAGFTATFAANSSDNFHMLCSFSPKFWLRSIYLKSTFGTSQAIIGRVYGVLWTQKSFVFDAWYTTIQCTIFSRSD